MNAKQRYNNRRSAAHHARKNAELRMNRTIGVSLMDVSHRVCKALTLIDYKASPRPTIEIEDRGPTCLPEVAVYAAGYRKSENITAR